MTYKYILFSMRGFESSDLRNAVQCSVSRPQ